VRVCVPVNTRFGVPEVRHLLADAAVDAVAVADDEEPVALVRAVVPDPGSAGRAGLPALRLAVAVADRPVAGFHVISDEPGPVAPDRAVELRPGATASAADLQEFCAAAMARFKVPRHVRFVTGWPMSATKIQKGPLRQRIADELTD